MKLDTGVLLKKMLDPRFDKSVQMYGAIASAIRDCVQNSGDLRNVARLIVFAAEEEDITTDKLRDAISWCEENR